MRRLRNLPTFRDCGKTIYPDSNEEIARGLQSRHTNLVCVCHNQYLGTKLPSKVLPGLNTAGYWDIDCEQQWGTNWHYNEGLEVTMIENGQATFAVEGQEYRLEPTTATFTRPWLHHRVGDPHVGASRIYWIMLDVGVRRPRQAWKWPSWILLTPADREELARLSAQFPQHVWQAGPDLRRCFHRLGDSVRTNSLANSISLISCLVNEALVLLLQALRCQWEKVVVKPDPSREVVELFWRELEQNPAQLGTEWTLSKMLQRCGLGRTQFTFYTKQIFNHSPMQHLNHCRLEWAARLLKSEPQWSITKIALECGFSTNQHFSKCFREYFYCPPRIFRLGTR